MEKYLATYKFYNKRGRRMSIFAVPEKNELKIYAIECSTEDQFVKKTGRQFIENYLKGIPDECTPKIYTVKLSDDRYKNAFMNFCKNTFYKKIYMPVIEIKEELVLGKDFYDIQDLLSGE